MFERLMGESRSLRQRQSYLRAFLFVEMGKTQMNEELWRQEGQIYVSVETISLFLSWREDGGKRRGGATKEERRGNEARGRRSQTSGLELETLV